MKSNSNGHFNEETASIIKSHAKCSVGIADISFNIHIPQLIESIEFLNTQIKIIEKEIDKILKEINSVILSIPGISNNACASILGEIGNISNFSKPSKLLTFVGL